MTVRGQYDIVAMVLDAAWAVIFSTREIHASDWPTGRIGSGRKFNIFISCLLENLSAYNKVSMLAQPCNIHFTMINFAAHYTFECKFNNTQDVSVVAYVKTHADVWRHHKLVGSDQGKWTRERWTLTSSAMRTAWTTEHSTIRRIQYGIEALRQYAV